MCRVRRVGVAILAAVLMAWQAAVMAAVVAEDTAPVRGDRPEDYLRDIGSALRNLDYKGVFLYEQGGRKTSQQWVHIVRDGVEHERLLGLDGGRREVLRDRPLGCLSVEGQGIRALLSSALSDTQVNGLRDEYHLALGAPEMVAGREAIPLVIEPQDEFRRGYRLLVDKESRLLLGADTLDHAGNLLDRFRFLTILIGPVPDSDILPVTASYSRMDEARCVSSAQVSAPAALGWTVELPTGFALCHQEQRTQAGVPEDVLTYSDGLSHFTVFIRQGDAGLDGGQLQQGNTLLRSQSLQVGDKTYHVTVVGDVPETLMQRVLTSFKPVPGL